MSSIKVSALTAKTSPSGSEELLINDGGTSKKITIANLPDTDTVYTHPNHSGDVVSSADGATTIQVDAVDIAMLSATGTASSTTFLRGDNTWVVPTDTNTNTNQLTTFTVSATTDTTATTISQGDDLMFTAGTGITCETTADGTVTISNTVTDTNTTYTATGLLSIDGSNVITTTANNYTHPNHSGEVTSTGDGATVVADNVVDEANLKVSNAPTNGQFLSAQSAASGGLTWAAVDALPSQTGNAGKYLTTDATDASWATLDTDANTTTKGLYEHAHTINTAYSITSTNNAMSAGPVVIGSSGSVTVPSTSVWTIV